MRGAINYILLKTFGEYLYGISLPKRCFQGFVLQFLDTLLEARTSQDRRTFIPLSVSLRNDLGDSAFDGVGLAGLRAGLIPLCVPELLAPFLSSTAFYFTSIFFQMG